MGTVYIDVLITVNIFIDFFLILCTKTLLHISQKLSRLVLGAVLGGVFSLAALLPRIPFGLNILFDAALAAPVILVSFGFYSARVFIKRVSVYFFCSFFFCGIMIFVYTSFKPKGMEIYNDVIYFNISPFLLIILTLVCYYLMKLASRFSEKSGGKRVCGVKVVRREHSVRFNALIDTGCQVKEPFSGDYVIIAEKTLIYDLIPEETAMRVIPFGSLGGEGIIKGFLPDIVEIDGKPSQQSLYIGICENILKGDVRAIIPFEPVKNI